MRGRGVHLVAWHIWSRGLYSPVANSRVALKNPTLLVQESRVYATRAQETYFVFLLAAFALAARRLIFRATVFLWKSPRFAALAIADSA